MAPRTTSPDLTRADLAAGDSTITQTPPSDPVAAPTMADMQAMTDPVTSDPAKLADFMADNPLLGEDTQAAEIAAALDAEALANLSATFRSSVTVLPIINTKVFPVPMDREFTMVTTPTFVQTVEEGDLVRLGEVMAPGTPAEPDLVDCRVNAIVMVPGLHAAVKQSARTDRVADQAHGQLEEHYRRELGDKALAGADLMIVLYLQVDDEGEDAAEQSAPEAVAA